MIIWLNRSWIDACRRAIRSQDKWVGLMDVSKGPAPVTETMYLLQINYSFIQNFYWLIQGVLKRPT